MTTRSDLRALWPVGLFTFAYLTAALPVALMRGNIEFVMYIAVMLVLISFVYWMYLHVRLSNGVLWCLSVWGLAHMAGGLVVVPMDWPVEAASHVLYSWWLVPELLKYDQVVHAYGFGVATWVCWQGLATAIERRGGTAMPTLGLMVIAACAGMGLGALNEVIEFAATILIPETNVGGYFNTGWDLVANFAGATVSVSLIWAGSRSPDRAARQTGSRPV